MGRPIRLAGPKGGLPEEEKPLADLDRELLSTGDLHAFVQILLGLPVVATPEGDLAESVQGNRPPAVVSRVPDSLQTGPEGGLGVLDPAGLKPYEPEGL